MNNSVFWSHYDTTGVTLEIRGSDVYPAAPHYALVTNFFCVEERVEKRVEELTYKKFQAPKLHDAFEFIVLERPNPNINMTSF